MRFSEFHEFCNYSQHRNNSGLSSKNSMHLRTIGEKTMRFITTAKIEITLELILRVSGTLELHELLRMS